MMTAFLVANPDDQTEAAAAAVCAMGLAGEIGWSRMQEGDGNSTYRNGSLTPFIIWTGLLWTKAPVLKSDREDSYGSQ